MLCWGLATLEISGGLIHPWRCRVFPRWWHWIMARRHWLLDYVPTGADVPGKWHPWRLYPEVTLVGWRCWRNILQRNWLLASGTHSGSWMDLMAWFYRDAGSGGIFHGGTESWLLALTLDLCSRDRMVPWRECAEPVGACIVDDADAKCGHIGWMRHSYFRQNNTSDGANATPWLH